MNTPHGYSFFFLSFFLKNASASSHLQAIIIKDNFAVATCILQSSVSS